MACQIPRFRPLPQNINVSNNWADNMANFQALWINSAQLINDTKEKEAEVDERLESFEVLVGSDLATITLRLDTVETDIAGINSAAAALELRVTSNEGNIATANLNITANTNDIADSAAAIATLQLDVANNVGDIASAGLLISANTSAITGNSTAITALDTRVTSAEGNIAAANLVIASNTSSITGNTSAIAALTTRVDTAEGDIAAAELNIASNSSSITTLSGTVTTNVNSIAALTTRVTTAEGDIAAAELNISSNSSSISTANGNIATNTSSIASLTTRVTTAEGDISAAELSIVSNTADITTVEGDIVSINSSIATLTTTANTANTNASSALSLASIAINDVGILEANAFLVVSTTVGGFTRIAGIKATANSSTTKLAFVGDTMEWLDSSNNTALSFDTFTDKFIYDTRVQFKGSISVDAGSTIDIGEPSTSLEGHFSTFGYTSGGLNVGTMWSFGNSGEFTAGYNWTTNLALFSGANTEVKATNNLTLTSVSAGMDITANNTIAIESTTSNVLIECGASFLSDKIQFNHNASTVAEMTRTSGGVNRFYVPNGYMFATRSATGSSQGALGVAQLSTGAIATYRSGSESTVVSTINNSGAFINTSTLRNKNVLSRITNTLDDLCSIIENGMLEYISTIGMNSDIQFGLGAEEVEPIYPELCSYGDDGLVSGLDYARFTAPILVALKEIKDSIDSIDSRVTTLETP